MDWLDGFTTADEAGFDREQYAVFDIALGESGIFMQPRIGTGCKANKEGLGGTLGLQSGSVRDICRSTVF